MKPGMLVRFWFGPYLLIGTVHAAGGGSDPHWIQSGPMLYSVPDAAIHR